LLSTSPTDALSANQGRVLKDLIDNITVGVDWGDIGGTLSNQTDLNNKFNDYQLLSQKGAANGYAPLDSGAKVPISNLPDSVVGQVEYQGTWAASTNTPTLANPPSSTTKGHYYVASDSGTQFGISFQTGDWIISNGSAWEKVDNTDAVTSVFGRLGNVVANAGDYTFAQIGSKPTTLSGYGITDAYTKTESDANFLGISAKAADSDLLDGVNSSQFLRSDQNDSTTGILRMALNSGINGFGIGTGNVSYFSFYESNGSTRQGYIGFPSAGNSDLLVKNDISNTQIVLEDTGGLNGLSYFDGSSARTVWHSGNDGAGSGLDADLLDGVQGSDYARTDIAETFSNSITALSYKTTNWEIVESAGVLQFKYGGVTKFEMNSSGIMEAADTFKQRL